MVTIATWNINSVRLRIDQVERFLSEQAPDVLCLQEIKVAEHLFPHDMFERLGYTHRAIHGQKGYHGVATVSRIPMREFSRHDWQDNGEARHVGVELLGPGQGVLLENVYIPAGGDIADRTVNPKFGQKLDFIERMTRWSDTLDRPTILTGDFNIAPLECDVYDHKALLKVVSHTPLGSKRLPAWAMRMAGSIWGASISPRPNAITAGGAIVPFGVTRTRAAGWITCGRRPIWRSNRSRTALSKKRAAGTNRAITCR